MHPPFAAIAPPPPIAEPRGGALFSEKVVLLTVSLLPHAIAPPSVPEFLEK